MTDDFAVLCTSADLRSDRSKLRGILETHLRVEHACSVRQLVMVLLAVFSLPVWVTAVWPAWMADGLRSVVLAAWFVCFVGLATAAISEWRWRSRLDAVLARRPQI